MVVLACVISSLITAVVVFIILYLFYFKSMFGLVKEERIRSHTEQEIGFNESKEELLEIKENKEESGNALIKRE